MRKIKYAIHFGKNDEKTIMCTDLAMARAVAKSVKSDWIERREYIELD